MRASFGRRVGRGKSSDGVQAVLTGATCRFRREISPSPGRARAVRRTRPVIGDPVAAVAAGRPRNRTAALDLIKGRVRAAQSRSPPPRRRWSTPSRVSTTTGSGNLHKLIDLEFGDADEGIAEGDLVREDLFSLRAARTCPMEQHAALAQWSPDPQG